MVHCLKYSASHIALSKGLDYDGTPIHHHQLFTLKLLICSLLHSLQLHQQACYLLCAHYQNQTKQQTRAKPYNVNSHPKLKPIPNQKIEPMPKSRSKLQLIRLQSKKIPSVIPNLQLLAQPKFLICVPKNQTGLIKKFKKSPM